MLKYGVVRMDDLVQDIQQWDRFYLSGRLQKPVWTAFSVLVNIANAHKYHIAGIMCSLFCVYGL